MQTETQATQPSRFDYVKYDQTATASQAEFKQKFQELEAMILRLPAGRPTELAVAHLEETYMWVGKALRDDQIKRNGSAPLQEARNDS